MNARMERIVLYMVVLALAIAVGWLAFKGTKGPVDDCVGCKDELKPLFDAINTALGDLGEKVATHGATTTIALNRIAETVADVTKKVEGKLEGLEEDIADAVSKRLLAAGCQVTKTAEDCEADPPPHPHPTPATVESQYTLLYENARLNEDGKLAPNSVGVKLELRHQLRLQRLATAFKPCDEKDNPVRFAVTGYASSAEFLSQPDGGPLPNSDALNRETAELRERIVRDYLRDHDFEVVAPGNDLPRPFRDDALSSVDQQALNRTVFIEIVSAGTCDLSR